MTLLQQQPMMDGMPVTHAAVTDLDAPPAPAPKPASRQRWTVAVPWGLAVVFFLAFAAALRLPAAPAPVISQPEPTPTVAATDPVVDEKTSEGIGRGATVYRDAEGQIVAVMDSVLPLTRDGAAWCELTVDGQTVRDEQTGGAPAVCVWVRDAE